MAFLTEAELTAILESDKAPALTTDLAKQNMGVLVENQAKYVSEDVAGASADVAGFTNILVPAIRRIMPALFAQELVSVQPMNGPTGYAYAQRFYYKGSKTTPLLANATIVTGTDLIEHVASTTAGLVMLYKETDKDGKIIKALAQESRLANNSVGVIGVGTYGVVATWSTQSAFKQILKNYTGPYTTAEGEVLGNAMNQVSFKIDRVTVTAKTRKLKSEFSIEMVQDLQSQHGQNAEAELLDLIEFELQADIDQEILGFVKADAIALPDVVVNNVVGTTEASKFQGIYTQVVNACEKIVHGTKRGAGNIVVASPKVIAALSLTGKLTGVAADLNNNVKSGQGVGITFVGTLDNGAKVFRDAFATKDEVLVAYKGSTAADAGAFYCPYIPLMTQKATDPETLQPVIAMMTRYAIAATPLLEAGQGNPFYMTFGVSFAGTTLAA